MKLICNWTNIKISRIQVGRVIGRVFGLLSQTRSDQYSGYWYQIHGYMKKRTYKTQYVKMSEAFRKIYLHHQNL